MTTEPLGDLRLPMVAVQPRPDFAEDLLSHLTGRARTTPRPVAAQEVTPTVRYFVRDLGAAVEFYQGVLGFELEVRSPPWFAMLRGAALRLLLSVPGGPGAGSPLPDGSVPEPGGWNRLVIEVADLGSRVEALQALGVTIRTGISAGIGVLQVLLADPSDNLVELFERTPGDHERARP